MTLSVAEAVTVEAGVAMTAIPVSRANAMGAVTWNAVTAGLPPGVTFNTSSGRFEGTPTTRGVYGPITVTGRDSLNDTATSNPIVITVHQDQYFSFKDPSAYPFPTFEKRIAGSFDLRNLISDDMVGMTKNDIAFTVAWNERSGLPNWNNDLILTDGVWAGTVRNSGTGQITVTAKWGTITQTQAYTFSSVLPQSSIKLSTDETALGAVDFGSAYTSVSATDLLTVVKLDKSQVRWATSNPASVKSGETAGLPPGISVNATTGLVSGTPSAIGKYRFNLKATFDNTNAAVEHFEDTREYVIAVQAASYKFKSVATGSIHACGIAVNNNVYCWGQGVSGRLGNNTTANSLVPVLVQGIVGTPRQIVASNNFTCTVTDGDEMYCWGYNSYNQISTADTQDKLTAVKTPLTAPVKSVALSTESLCALSTGGTLYCWGKGQYGKLLTGNGGDQVAPVVAFASGVKSVTMMADHSCADLTNNTTMCAGYNYDGRVGNGTNTANINAPVLVQNAQSATLTNVNYTVVTGGATCHLMVNGSVNCHGRGQEGNMGNGTLVSNLRAAPVNNLTIGVKQLVGGGNHFCGLMSNDTVRCWGANGEGQLGNGNQVNQSTPVAVQGLAGPVASLSAGDKGTCAVYQDGTAACWGIGWVIGNGSSARKLVPTQVGG
jgi:alpha-tubulin suppressor-like RCC1 family protein